MENTYYKELCINLKHLLLPSSSLQFIFQKLFEIPLYTCTAIFGPSCFTLESIYFLFESSDLECWKMQNSYYKNHHFFFCFLRKNLHLISRYSVDGHSYQSQLFLIYYPVPKIGTYLKLEGHL